MTYPPPNPYQPDPNRPHQPGYGTPPNAGQHYTTDSDPYMRPDVPPVNHYGTPPLNVMPGSVPQGPHASPYQPVQFAPPPKRGSNTPLLITIVVVTFAVVVGGVVIGLTLSDSDDAASGGGGGETSSAAEPTSKAEPTSEEPTEGPTENEPTAEYRAPKVDECIEDNASGFYVVACDAPTAYWLVLHIAHNPEDPDPEDATHALAAYDACEDYEWTNYYYTDTSVTANRDWDPDKDRITAIYCVREV